MPTYICHFCDYTTKYMSHFKNHIIIRKKKCNHILSDKIINCLDDYEELKQLHQKEPDNPNWNVPIIEKPKPKRIKKEEQHTCQYCEKILKSKQALKYHINNSCNKKQMEDLQNFINNL